MIKPALRHAVVLRCDHSPPHPLSTTVRRWRGAQHDVAATHNIAPCPALLLLLAECWLLLLLFAVPCCCCWRCCCSGSPLQLPLLSSGPNMLHRYHHGAHVPLHVHRHDLDRCGSRREGERGGGGDEGEEGDGVAGQADDALAQLGAGVGGGGSHDDVAAVEGAGEAADLCRIYDDDDDASPAHHTVTGHRGVDCAAAHRSHCAFLARCAASLRYVVGTISRQYDT